MRSDVAAENPKHFMKIKFLNKAVDAINLSALLQSISVTDKLPVYFRIHQHTLTLLPANYLTLHQPFQIWMFLNISLIHKLASVHKESKFCYEPHGPVITGDLRIIENATLRELVAKGPKYREPNRVNWKATQTIFLESIDLYAKNWSKREQVELRHLSEWKDQLKK